MTGRASALRLPARARRCVSTPARDVAAPPGFRQIGASFFQNRQAAHAAARIFSAPAPNQEPPPWSNLDLALRGAAIVVLLLLAVLMAHAPVGRDGRLSVAAVAVTKSSFPASRTWGEPWSAASESGSGQPDASWQRAMPLAVTLAFCSQIFSRIPPTPR